MPKIHVLKMQLTTQLFLTQLGGGAFGSNGIT